MIFLKLLTCSGLKFISLKKSINLKNTIKIVFKANYFSSLATKLVMLERNYAFNPFTFGKKGRYVLNYAYFKNI